MWLRKGHEAAIMDEIKDIYNRELYQPFVEYCAAHGYRTMRDRKSTRLNSSHSS